MIVALMLLMFIVLFMVGVPVSASMIIAAGIGMAATGQGLIGIAQHMTAAVQSIELMAIPLFILTAHLMTQLGMIQKIFDFADAAIGWLKGGLAHATVLAGFVFSGISGAAVADLVALGAIAMKQMPKAGYSPAFGAAVVMSVSTLGGIIPPAIMMVVYAIMANVSIARMFLAGVIPGLLIAGSISAMIAAFGWLNVVPMPPVTRFDKRRLWATARSAILALVAPLVILRGMSSGFVTPTEAGVLACLYTLLVGLIERTLTVGKVIKALQATVESSSLILFILAASSVMSYVFIAQGTAEAITSLFSGARPNASSFLLMTTLILLGAGHIIETMPALLLTVPLLLPTANALHIDPVHFGVLVVFNLLISIMSPPMGIGLYILSAVSGISFGKLAWAAVPFFLLLMFVLMLLTFVPQLVLWLPQTLMPLPSGVGQ